MARNDGVETEVVQRLRTEDVTVFGEEQPNMRLQRDEDVPNLVGLPRLYPPGW